MGDSMETLVSIVIPAFNRESSIVAAVESVLRQSWTDIEVIVVDDASTDGTVAAARTISDPRFRLIESARNGGISAARNAGIGAAKGSWIAFQDSDDEWLPTKLEKQMARLLGAPDDVIASYCGFLILDEPGAERPRAGVRYCPDAGLRLLDGQILETLLVTNPVSTQTLVARKSVLEAVGLFDEGLKSLVDWDLGIRLAQAGRFQFIDEPLVIQRFSANSITKDEKKRVQSWEHVLQKHKALMQQHPAALLAHYTRLSGGNRRMGNRAKALEFNRAARALAPTDLKLLALSVRLRFGG